MTAGKIKKAALCSTDSGCSGATLPRIPKGEEPLGRGARSAWGQSPRCAAGARNTAAQNRKTPPRNARPKVQVKSAIPKKRKVRDKVTDPHNVP